LLLQCCSWGISVCWNAARCVLRIWKSKWRPIREKEVNYNYYHNSLPLSYSLRRYRYTNLHKENWHSELHSASTTKKSNIYHQYSKKLSENLVDGISEELQNDEVKLCFHSLKVSITFHLTFYLNTGLPPTTAMNDVENQAKSPKVVKHYGKVFDQISTESFSHWIWLILTNGVWLIRTEKDLRTPFHFTTAESSSITEKAGRPAQSGNCSK
jgi:hypothetical protein